MSSEQVASILRQCSQQVRLVVARSVREPSATASDTPPFMSQRPSVTSETSSSITNNGVLSSLTSVEHDGTINSSQKKLLLRTERLLESNHNLEKILENLREQVGESLFGVRSSSFLSATDEEKEKKSQFNQRYVPDTTFE